MKKILIIAYTYPPDSRSGTYRVLHFANQLARNKNFQPFVLTLKGDCYEQDVHKDLKLVSIVDPGVTVTRTCCLQLRDLIISMNFKRKDKCATTISTNDVVSDHGKEKFQAGNVSVWQKIKDFITDELVSFPDRQVGWLPFAIWRAIRLIRTEGIDVMFATGSPWSSFVIGRSVKLITGIPLILDYRDPWTDNPFIKKEKQNSWFHKISRKLEERLVKSADAVILNTDSLCRLFERRFGTYRKFYTVYNGYLSQDILSLPSPDVGSQSQNGEFIFVYAGALYGHRSIINFLCAVKKIITDDLSGRIIIIKLIGVAPETALMCKQLLGDELFKHHCVTLPRVSHRECLSHMETAHCLLLFQQGTSLQIPRKIFEYLALRKPILAVVTEQGETPRLLTMCEAGLTVHDQEQDIYNGVMELLYNYADFTRKIQRNTHYKEFEVKKLTEKLETILESIV